MAVLSAIFKGVDEISNIMERIAASGQRAAEVWESAGTSADTAFERASVSAAISAETFDAVSASVSQTAEVTEQLARSSEDAAAATAEVSETLSQVTEESKATASAVDEVSESFSETAKASENTGITAADAIGTVQKALVAAGLANLLGEIVSAFMGCARAATEFENATAKISTIIDPAQISMKEISSDLLNLSRASKQSVAGLSEAAYEAISSDVAAADAVEFAGTATKLAAGGFTDAAVSVDVLTTAINAYGLETEEAIRISDMLITTQNLGKASVNELGSYMGKVIPLAAAYGVEMSEISAGYAILTANGIRTAETTTYLKAMLGELGTSSSKVAEILKAETGQSFAELMAGGRSLGEVLDVLGNSVNGDKTAFNELWGSSVAGIGALSLFNSGSEKFNGVLKEMKHSAGATERAYATMSGTMGSSQAGLANSADNLKIVVGQQLNPVLGKLYGLGTNIFDGISKLLTGCPVLTAVVIGVTTALGVAVGAIALVCTALTVKAAILPVVTTLMAAHGAAVTAAMGPIGLIAAAVGILVAGLVPLINHIENANKEFNSLTDTSKLQYEQLRETNSEYKKAVEIYGENSEQAKKLAQDVAALDAVYQANKMTMEEFIAQNNALIDSHNRAMDAYRDGNAEIRKEETASNNLIGKLSELSAKTRLTASEHQQMSAVVDRLAAKMPNLGLSYDKLTGKVSHTAAAIKEAWQAEKEERERAVQGEAYVAMLEKETALREQLALATDNSTAASKRAENAIAAGGGGDILGGWSLVLSGAGKAQQTAYNEMVRLQTALDENLALQAETAVALEAQSNAAVSYGTAVKTAVDGVSDDLAALAEAYDNVYNSARNNIDGVIGLFSIMKTETELSVQDMLAAFESQSTYLELYTENLKRAAALGLDEGLISQLSDGSAESDGQLSAIISEIERLGGTTAEAAEFVANFNAKFRDVEKAKDDFATNVAQMETDFSKSMDAIERKMAGAIDNMTMESGAADAAKRTISAYIEQVKSMTAQAHSAAEGVAQATKSALNNPYAGKAPRIYASVGGYASGTESATRGVHLVGENGPELIEFNGGETVHTADETRGILNNTNTAPLNTGVSLINTAPKESYGTGGEKTINLNINGSGAMNIKGNADKESILSVLIENIKPALMNIIRQETFEEGRLAYDY